VLLTSTVTHMKTVQIPVSSESFESIRQNRLRFLVVNRSLSVEVGDILIVLCVFCFEGNFYNDLVCRTVTEVTPSDEIELHMHGRGVDLCSISSSPVGCDFF